MESARIMVVEDERIVARDIKNRLKALGYGVPAVASTGKEAIRKAEEVRPDLVLMDIVLRGGVDGVEAAEQIYARFNIPVVYVTARSDKGTLERAKATEPFGYILKPFEVGEIRSAVEIALYKHKAERKLKEKKNWFTKTLKSVTDAVIVTDAGGFITFMNPDAEPLTGRKWEGTSGKALAEVSSDATEKTTNPTTLMIVTPYTLVREAIQKTLEHEADIEIVARASDCSELIQLVGQKKPHVLLVDTDVTGLDVVGIVGSIREEGADTKVILFFHTPDEGAIVNAFYSGVRGCLTDESDAGQLLEAIRAVSRGECWMGMKTTTEVLNRLLPPGKVKPLLKDKLTKKEKEIVEFVKRGFSNKRISNELFISENTVKTHLASIFNKLGVSNRVKLALCAG